MNKKNRIAIGALSVVWLLTIIYLPSSIYGSFAVTLLLSILVFGSIERDKSGHERSFYFRGTPSESTLAWLRLIGNTEIFLRGLLLATTAIFLFHGTNAARIHTNRTAFVTCTILSFLAILILDRRAGFDALRWGYVRISLLAGVMISIPLGKAAPIGLTKIIWKLMKFWYNGNAGVGEVVEVVNSLAAHLNNLTRWYLKTSVGDTAGSLISAALSTNVIYGFIVVLYAAALHQGIRWVAGESNSPPAPQQ